MLATVSRYIVGQGDAKRAVAIALRNRWRRHKLPQELRSEVHAPKPISESMHMPHAYSVNNIAYAPTTGGHHFTCLT